ncbi:MAG: TSUP family transporter, partial [Ignavibacteriae bacterium]|nr:TSUP family transporter [Ignavibacteriota bacterium]
MNATEVLQFVVLGFAVGVLSGMIGVGGAVFIVPALVYLFGWEQ